MVQALTEIVRAILPAPVDVDAVGRFYAFENVFGSGQDVGVETA